MSAMLKAPFPYFGGKSRVASEVWKRFGNVPNYVEPFAGSLAVLLARPHAPKVETVNDKDAYIANFWRALQHAPDEVAKWADYPINEVDLHARHLWLIQNPPDIERLMTDPDYYDTKRAGWWAWGICCWLGGRWCSQDVLTQTGRTQRRIFNSSYRGILRMQRGDGLNKELAALSERLRGVRVTCGDWQRITRDTFSTQMGVTGLFLDPPYSQGDGDVYSEVDQEVAHNVREYAKENGDNPLLRIALCGYEGEHEMPDKWECVGWKAIGGFSRDSNPDNDNAKRERIWFSPHCLKPDRNLTLFDLEAVA